jgi:hypothetical protein
MIRLNEIKTVVFDRTNLKGSGKASDHTQLFDGLFANQSLEHLELGAMAVEEGIVKALVRVFAFSD